MAFDLDADGNLIEQKLGGFDLDADGNLLGSRAPVEGGFAASAKQAIGSVVKGAGQAAADYLPGVGQDNAVKRYGQGVIDANPTAVQSLSDIADKPGTAVTEATGNAAGSMAGMVGARAVGMGITAMAPLTGPAAPVTAAIGQAIAWFGPAAVAALPSYGSIRDKQMLANPEANEEWKDKAIATLGAAAVGAIESKFGPQQWAMGALTKEGREQLAEKFAAATLTGAIGKGVVRGAAIEGAEELVQNPIEQLASYEDPTTAKSLKETAFGGAMGAIGGGVLGGGTAGITGRTGKPEVQQPEPDPVPAILNAVDVDSAIEAAQAATQERAAGLFEQQTNPLLDAMREREANPPVFAPANDAASLLDRQGLGDPLAPLLEDRRVRTEAFDAVEAEAAQAEQQKLAEMEAIPEIAARQNTVQAAVSRAGELEAPTAMQLALQRANVAPAPAIEAEPVQPVVEPAAAELPRVIPRAEGLVALPQKLAEQRAAANPSLEVVRFANIDRATGEPNGKYAYTVIPKATDASTPLGPGAVPDAAAGGRSVDPNAGLDAVDGVRAPAGPAVAAGDGARQPAGEPVSLGGGQRADAVEPAETWFGRRGSGYVTLGDAQMALPSRERAHPELDWTVEKMPSGAYRLAGYAGAGAQSANDETQRQGAPATQLPAGDGPRVQALPSTGAADAAAGQPVGGGQPADAGVPLSGAVQGGTARVTNEPAQPQATQAAAIASPDVEAQLRDGAVGVPETRVAGQPAPAIASAGTAVEPGASPLVGGDRADVRNQPSGPQVAPPQAASPEAVSVPAPARVETISTQTTSQPADLSDDQRAVLVEALGEDFESAYQQDIKDAILEKRGLKKPVREAAQMNTPMRSWLRAVGIAPALASDITGARGLRANNVLPNTFRKGGLELDMLVERAVEEGFLSQQEVEADSVDASNRLIEMIQADLRGERQVSADMATQEYGAQRDAQMTAEVEDAARKIGFDTQGLAPEQVAAALKRIERRSVLTRAKGQKFDAKREAAAVRAAYELANSVPPEVLAELEALAQQEKEASNRDYFDALIAGMESSDGQQETGQAQARGAGGGRAAGAAERGSPARNPDGAGNPAARQEAEGLVSPTREDVLAQHERRREGSAAEAKAQREADSADKADREQRDIAARQDASAENFELGQDADDSLSGQGAMFRRGDTEGPTLRATQIQRAVDKLTLNWLKKPDIHILDSMADAPDPVRAVWEQQNSQGAVGDIEGFHWRGGVYLVADQLRSGTDVIRVLYHESLGHFGLRQVFGKDLDRVLRQVAAVKPKEMRAKAEQYGFDLTNERQRMSAAEEILAEMAQDRPENTLVQKAVAIVRKFLRENVPGFAAMRMTDAEIIEQFLAPAREFVENGRRKEPSFMREGDDPQALRVFHGTPHEFDKFSTDAMGTGEGNQSYGWGLYFAGKREVAEHYRKVLSGKDISSLNDRMRYVRVGGKSLTEQFPDVELDAKLADFAEAGDDFGATFYADERAANWERLKDDESYPFRDYAKGHAVAWRDLAKALESGKKLTSTAKGRLYEVEIPEDGEYLLWDKPLSEQPEAVREALNGLRIENRSGQDMLKMDPTGEAIVIALGKDEQASRVLQDEGIAGIKFLDGSSRTRTLRDVKREFLSELPEDADFNDVTDLIGSGTFSPANEAILKELAANDWLGFDYPAQAISAALSGKLSDYDASPKLVKAVSDAQDGGTYNYVIFDDSKVSIEAAFSRSDDAKLNEDDQKAGEKPADFSPAPREGAKTGQGSDSAMEAMRKQRAEKPMFSRSVVTGQTLAQTWQAPDATKLDDFLYSMQDKHIDTKRVMKSVRDAIGAIADQQDPYLQEELFHGRAAKATKEFLETQVRPLLVDLQARGIDISDFEEYLHNRHAERRNVQVAKVNPNMKDGGSGIKTADARAYLAGLPAGKATAYKALARRVDQINKDTRALLVSSGLEKQATIDAWDAAYGDEYVPLMREEMDGGAMGIGQGFSVRGSSSKRAMGSNKPVANILANIALQREKAITRSEKRRIGEALYGLVLKAPNDDFWFAIDPALQNKKTPNQIMATQLQLISMGMDPLDAENIAKEPTQRYVGPDGKVHDRINPALRSADNVLAVRIDGEDKYVFFNAKDERAMRMAKALKNLDADQLGTVMGTVAKMTRYFSAINTQYNPIFGVTNIVRDVQAAVLNLNSTALKDHKADVMKHILPALRGIYIDLREHRAGRAPTSSYAAIFEEFQREGGATGFRDMYANAKERADDIASELKAINDGKAMKLGKGIMAWLSDYNESMENAVRVAAYKVGKEQGMTNQQAASLAKNLTVNFNRKGQVALQAGALYAFFNAAVQGTARISQTLFTDGKLSAAGRKIITGGMLLGSMQALLLAMAGFDDDEPPDFVRERSLIIPIGDKKYISIPMPLGFHVIPNLGRIPAEWAMGGFKNTPKRIGQLVGLFADAFNPIGSAGLSLQTLTPTIIDPLAALSENKDFTGKPIAKKDFDALHPSAGHTRAKDTATPWAKLISYGMNMATGGTDYKPGLASPTPDQIDYLIGQVTGGVGREVGKLSQVGSSALSGEELPMHKIPLVGRFVGTTEGQAAESARFYDNLRQIGEHKAELDGLRKDRKGNEASAYLKENREALLVPLADRVQREVSKLNTTKRDLVKAGASKERVKLLDMAITARMKLLNDRVRAMEKEPA